MVFAGLESLPRVAYRNVKTSSSEVLASGAGCLRIELPHPRILRLQLLAMHEEEVGLQQIILRHHHPLKANHSTAMSQGAAAIPHSKNKSKPPGNVPFEILLVRQV